MVANFFCALEIFHQSGINEASARLVKMYENKMLGSNHVRRENDIIMMD
jgi:hypothetical protein